MNRRLTLTTGIVLSTLSLLYLGGSTYRARAPFKVDTLGTLNALTLGQADAPLNMVVFTDYRCPHCRAFEGTVMPPRHQRSIKPHSRPHRDAARGLAAYRGGRTLRGKTGRSGFLSPT